MYAEASALGENNGSFELSVIDASILPENHTKWTKTVGAASAAKLSLVDSTKACAKTHIDLSITDK